MINPVSLGTLKDFDNGVKGKLIKLIDERIEMGTGYFSEFVESDFEQHKKKRLLVLPANTVINGSLNLDFGQKWLTDNNIAGIFCEGNLTIRGDALNCNINSGLFFFVAGNLECDNLVGGGGRVLILGNVVANDGVVVGDYNDGVIRIGGTLTSRLYLVLDHDCIVCGEKQTTELWWDDGALDKSLVPEVFLDENLDEVSVNKLLNRSRFGLSLLQTDKQEDLAGLQERIKKRDSERPKAAV